MPIKGSGPLRGGGGGGQRREYGPNAEVRKDKVSLGIWGAAAEWSTAREPELWFSRVPRPAVSAAWEPVTTPRETQGSWAIAGLRGPHLLLVPGQLLGNLN